MLETNSTDGSSQSAPGDTSRRNPAKRNIIIRRSTPIPNFFVDCLMSLVSPAYWNVLCFIWRKTVGWDKTFDFISLSQITLGTGLCRDTVIKATVFWEQAGIWRRETSPTLRGITLYTVFPLAERELISQKVKTLVEDSNQSSRLDSSSRKSRSSPVGVVDTHKALKNKTQDTKAIDLSLIHKNREEKPSATTEFKIREDLHV